MLIVIALIFAYLFFPFFGLFNYDGFGGKVKFEMIYLYSIHIFIEFSIIILGVILLSKIRESSIITIKYNLHKIMKLSIYILLAVIFINLFLFGNYHILIGDIGRGEFRTTLNLGFIYLFLSFYLPGVILALNTYLYAEYTKLGLITNKHKKKLFIIFVFAMFIGFLTGFKSTAIIIALMGITGMSSIIKIRHLIFVSLIFIILMAISGYVFMHFNNFTQVFFYLFKRATSVAVEGTVGVFNLFPNGGKDSYLILLYNLGNHLASFLYGYPKNSIEFLYIDLGRLIGYLTYPQNIAEEAVSGAFNLTITNFGEAIYLFGKKFFYLYTIFISIYIILLMYLFKKVSFDLKVIIIVYFFTSIVIGAGKVTNIFAITTFVYLIICYVLVELILSYGRIKYESY